MSCHGLHPQLPAGVHNASNPADSRPVNQAGSFSYFVDGDFRIRCRGERLIDRASLIALAFTLSGIGTVVTIRIVAVTVVIVLIAVPIAIHIARAVITVILAPLAWIGAVDMANIIAMAVVVMLIAALIANAVSRIGLTHVSKVTTMTIVIVGDIRAGRGLGITAH